MKPQLLAYYFPGFHNDPSLYPDLPPDWSEWDLVRTAQPFFPGHVQPRSPLWGFEDELSPPVMEKKLAVAGSHAIDSMVFIVYQYGNASPGLEVLKTALEATPPGGARPAMMWANHRRYWCYPEPENQEGRVYLEVDYSRERLRAQVHRWCAEVWNHPAYFRLPDGRPLFILYAPQAFADATSLGELRWFLEHIQQEASDAGLPRLHLHASSTTYIRDEELLWCGFDSCSDYLALGYLENPRAKEPRVELPNLAGDLIVKLSEAERLANVDRTFAKLAAESPIPYMPSVTVGRDCSPRVRAPGEVRSGHYSSRPILRLPPHEVAPMALTVALRHLPAGDDDVRFVLLNAWNEWTEGAFLEPDTEHGLTTLDLIARHWRASWTPAS